MPIATVMLPVINKLKHTRTYLATIDVWQISRGNLRPKSNAIVTTVSGTRWNFWPSVDNMTWQLNFPRITKSKECFAKLRSIDVEESLFSNTF